jgi:hypothetical protein
MQLCQTDRALFVRPRTLAYTVGACERRLRSPEVAGTVSAQWLREVPLPRNCWATDGTVRENSLTIGHGLPHRVLRRPTPLIFARDAEMGARRSTLPESEVCRATDQ